MSRPFSFLRPGWQKSWKSFALETGASFGYEKARGLRKTPTIRATYKNWIIKIDAPKRGKKATVTRVRAAYLNSDSFYFCIYREGLYQGIKKMMGMQDIIIGHPAFDDAFIIQGNDERKLQSLFNNQRLRELIHWQPDIHLKNIVDEEWKLDEEQKGLSVLEFKIMGLISNPNRLHDLYELFAELLEQLVAIGSSHPEGPLPNS
ncbi:MAG: DUF3137 domain-containing protein [Bacteroidota bacterium]